MGIFNEFLGKGVKVPYLDGERLKIARGTLEDVSNGLLRIQGSLGVVLINRRNVQKVTKIN